MNYPIIIFLLQILQSSMQAESIQLKQSPNDKRQYEAVVLQNKLKVIFIHDDQIAKSACSISVGVGSMFDKDRSLGLAHFLQHMLFMGSKKFQEHNQYSSFISTNSGMDNAYTSDTETNYYFQIKNSAFYEAVERLANFFTGALLKQQCIQKQSQAVHQQFVLWSNDDNCRKWEVLRKLASPPYSRFTIGNTDTLRHEHIREDLVQFYEKYYSANIINAVMCSNESIEEMKKNIIPILEAIPNKNVELPQLDLHYKKQQTGKMVFMQSIKDEAIMEYFWVTQYLQPHYKKHLSDYITHVIGHQGKNSLLSILKFQKYASSIQAYTHNLKTQTLIGMEVKLTELGEQHYQKVYNIVMDFMSSLKPELSIFEEIKQRKLIQFQFKEKQRVSQYVCRLSSKLHWVPLEEILNYQAIFQPFDQAWVSRLLGQINPFNVIVVFSSNSELEDPIKQVYLGAKYIVQDLPKREKSGITFSPMPPNKFIPIDTKMCAQPKKDLETPVKLNENIYFFYDSSFRVCKGGIYLRVFSKYSTVFLQFYANYLKMLLKELTYPAQTLQCTVQYDNDDCLTISVFGFSDIVIKVVQTIAEELHKAHNTKQSKALFDVALQDLIQKYENFYNQESDEVADQTLDIMLIKGYETIDKIMQELQGYKYKDTNEKIKDMWNNSKFQWIVVGNFDQDTISKLINKSEQSLKGKGKDIVVEEQSCLNLNHNIMHEIILDSQELSSSCSIVYFQAGSYSQQLYYKLLLLKNHIDEPFFNELRTQKQMAYYLAAKITIARGVLGMKFILVSSTRDPKNISDEIKTFVFNFFSKLSQDLEGANDGQLTKIKESVATKIKAPHPNLEALYDFVVQQIEEKTFYFNRKKEEEIKRYLNPIKVDDLKQTWNNMKNRTLEIYVVSKEHQDKYKEYGVVSESIESVRSKCGYWSHQLKKLATE